MKRGEISCDSLESVGMTGSIFFRWRRRRGQYLGELGSSPSGVFGFFVVYGPRK